MKKMKKLLTGLLALVMTITTVAIQSPITAKAATTPETIDTTRSGSLTIHKYEYNSTISDSPTGTEADAPGTDEVGIAGTDSPDDKAIPLDGVTFKITKVAELTDYYGTTGAVLPTVEQAKAMTAIGDSIEVTTSGGGIAEFKNLPLGLYLVQEISAPAQITGKTADFLVSIPMTTTDGTDWLYDVHVYPKNSSTYASVTLLKQGKIGDATATALPGATFELQVRSGTATPYTWTKVESNNKGVIIGTDIDNSGSITADEIGVLTTDSNGKITVADLAPGVYRFVEVGVPANSGYIMNGVDYKEFEITNNGDVLINNVVTDTTQNPITVINYKPDVEKEVKDREDGTWGDSTDYSKGDVIPYRITLDVPANVSELRNFTLTDTMENQKLTGTFRICSDASCATDTEITDITYTKPAADATSWTIEFNDFDSNDTPAITSALEKYAGQTIYIYFEAELTDAAVTTVVGNSNEIELKYSNKIVSDTETTNPSDDVITDETLVFTFEIAIEKTGEPDTGTDAVPLSGVTFDLYRKLADDATGDGVLNTATPADNLPAGLPTGKYEKVNTSAITTNGEGKVSVHGLANGTYYLVETATNSGYNLLKSPVPVTINVEYTTSTTTTTVATANGITTTTKTETTTFTAGTAGTSGDNGVFTVTVYNSKGFTLPSTGGVGTYIFVFVGVSMMAAAVILFFTTKKKEAQKN